MALKYWEKEFALLQVRDVELKVVVLRVQARVAEVPKLWTVPDVLFSLLVNVDLVFAVLALSCLLAFIELKLLQPHIDEMVRKLSQHLTNPEVPERFTLHFDFNPTGIILAGLFFSSPRSSDHCFVVDECPKLLDICLLPIPINHRLVDHRGPKLVLNLDSRLNLALGIDLRAYSLPDPNQLLGLVFLFHFFLGINRKHFLL